MTDVAYVTQEMWDRAQAALRATLPVIEQHVPKLSTAGTMVSLRDQVRRALAGTPGTSLEQAAREYAEAHAPIIPNHRALVRTACEQAYIAGASRG